MTKHISLIADHGLSLIYFLQSDLLQHCSKAGVEVILFTDDEALPAKLHIDFSEPGCDLLMGIRAKACDSYLLSVGPPPIQRWLDLLRWVGWFQASQHNRKMDGNYHILTVGYYSSRQRYVLPFLRVLIWMMRRSKILRRFIVHTQQRYTPNIYADLFEKYQPDLVVFPHTRMAARTVTSCGKRQGMASLQLPCSSAGIIPPPIT